MEQFNKTELHFFVALFAGVLLFTLYILKPFLPTLAVAAVFATLVFPVQKRLHMRLGNNALAALCTTLISFVVLVLPLGFLVALLVNEARGVAQFFGQARDTGLAELFGPLESFVAAWVPGAAWDLSALARESASWIASQLVVAFTGTAQLIGQFFIGFIALYYFLKDGPRFVQAFIHFSPLEDHYDRLLLDKLHATIYSVIRGSLSVALIQGVLTSIGFLLFSIPNPVLWGSMAAIGALIPGVGTGVVIVPAVVYLFFFGSLWQAVGLAVWGAVAVGLIDNLLLPKLLGGKARIHPLFILVSVLGGLLLLGPSGFILGPMVLSLLYGLGEVYSSLFKGHMEHAAAPTVSAPAVPRE